MSPGSTNIYKQQCGTETTQMPIIYEQSIYLKQTLFNLISQILSDVRCLVFALFRGLSSYITYVRSLY
ncbi:hypothetical protein NP493_8270g00001 [Ridgeia piscesae]|nr:hypothetical protein NP493_8270g00001 [Ridgeia piscesae]